MAESIRDKTSNPTKSEDYVDVMRMRGEPGKEYFDEEESILEREPNDGFHYYQDIERSKICNESPNLEPVQVDLEVIKRWNNLDDETRVEYKALEIKETELKQAKPAGGMSAYAFFVDACRKEHEENDPGAEIDFHEFSSKCSAKWNEFSDKEKKSFIGMAQKDEERYMVNSQDYTLSNRADPTAIKEKRVYKKSPSAPKRPLSAFFWFTLDERPKIMASNPEYELGEIAKELGRRWASADPETRAKYEAIEEEDKARYERKLTAYDEKQEISELS